MANIYQLKQELLAIFDELEENGGEITPELEEQLNITQESFKNKIEDYTNVVKMLQNDIIDIKAEKARLNDLQKSKEKTIERLKTIIVDAIELFGDTTKSGTKFIDYGTGKVSVKTTEAVEVDDHIINRFVNRYITGLKWYDNNNQLQIGLVNGDNLLEFANSKAPDEEDEDVIKLSFDDLKNLKAKLNAEVDLNSLLTSVNGFELAKALIRFGYFDVEAKADKVGIKRIAKEQHSMPAYANLVQNKSITIK